MSNIISLEEFYKRAYVGKNSIYCKGIRCSECPIDKYLCIDNIEEERKVWYNFGVHLGYIKEKKPIEMIVVTVRKEFPGCTIHDTTIYRGERNKCPDYIIEKEEYTEYESD